MKLVDNGEILVDNIEKIYNIILFELEENENCVIDFNGIKSMTTLFASQVFGKLYYTFGVTDYLNKIKLINMSDDIKLIMRLGLERYICEKMY